VTPPQSRTNTVPARGRKLEKGGESRGVAGLFVACRWRNLCSTRAEIVQDGIDLDLLDAVRCVPDVLTHTARIRHSTVTKVVASAFAKA
jgi:hypothetical protein